MHIVLNVGKKHTSLCLLSRYPFNKEHRIGDGERNRIFQFYRTHSTVHIHNTAVSLILIMQLSLFSYIYVGQVLLVTRILQNGMPAKKKLHDDTIV